MARAQRSAGGGGEGAGVSISLPDAKKWNRGGLDTVALTWPNRRGSRAMSALVDHPSSVPFARGVLLTDPAPSGLRLMAWPEYGVIKAEGRVAAIVDDDRESFRLADRRELLPAVTAARETLRDLLGVPLPEGADVVVSRFDLTTEREFDAAEGRALLQAMRALCPSGFVSEATREVDGTVRQVALKTARGHRTAFRAYDKGIESGSHPPGERVRFEAQNRRRPQGRPTPEQLVDADLRAAFGRTLEPFLKGEPVTVTHSEGVVDQLVRQVDEGTLTVARAERLVGAAELLRRYGRAIYADDRKSWRRLDALRRAGIAVDDQLPREAVVPVSQLLQEAVVEFAA